MLVWTLPQLGDPSCHLSCCGFQVPCCCTFIAPALVSWIIGESFHPVSSHCITGSQMTAKVVFQKHKLNIIFHCLQDWVKTSEFNTDHALFGCCFFFPISTPHPVFQADEVLTILYSTFIFNGPVPFPTVPTVWNVLTPTYLSTKLLLILQGHFGNHSSLISQLLLDCFCFHYSSYSL